MLIDLQLFTDTGVDVLKDPKVIAEIERVRKEEKKKLYSRVDQADKDNKELNERVNQILREKEEEKERARLAQEAVDKEKRDRELANMTAEQRIQTITKESEERVNAALNKSREENERIRKENERILLEAKREKKLRKAGIEDDEIADLISGESEAEIDAKIALIAKAKEKFGATTKKKKKKATKVVDDTEEDEDDDDEDEEDEIIVNKQGVKVNKKGQPVDDDGNVIDKRFPPSNAGKVVTEKDGQIKKYEDAVATASDQKGFIQHRDQLLELANADAQRVFRENPIPGQ